MQTSSASSQIRMRPANGISTSIDNNNQYDDIVMVEDDIAHMANTIQQQIPNIFIVHDRYLGDPICATPVLPGNSKITFSGSLLSAIKGFKDLSKDSKTRSASQQFVERVLVEGGSCSKLNPSIMKDYRLRLFSIDSDKIESLLSSEAAMNANLHDNISCAVDAIIYDDKVPGAFSPTPRERIRNWFPTVKQIGAESVEGYALKTSLSNGNNLFVMKAPRNPKNDELVHEALIGFYALNKLCHILPNYMYVYGYTKCSPPALQNKEAITWCSASSPAVSYLITENIRDAVTFGEFIVNPNVTAVDFLAVFYQLVNALNIAYKYYGYTHYDLHTGNVMIRRYPKMVAIPFFGTSDKPIGYIASVYVPYIIDYGFSRITVGGVGFGKIGLEQFGIDGNHAFPMYDTYKILAFLGNTLYTSPPARSYNEISPVLERLFYFFGEGTLMRRVEKRINNPGKDYYGADMKYRSVTHDAYITWLLSGSGINFHIYTNLLTLMSQGVYTAPINTEMDTCRFYSMVSSDDGPETSLEFCEAVGAINSDSILSPDSKQQALAWLNSSFDSDTYFRDTVGSINDKVNEVALIRSSRNISSGNIIPDLSVTRDLDTRSIVDLYRAHLIDLLKIKDMTADCISYLKASICSLATQGKYSIHKGELDILSGTFSEWTNFLESQREILKRNVIYAKSIKWDTTTSDKSVVKFWTKEHENLVLAV